MPGPAGLDRELGPVLLGRQPDRRSLDAQRQVLGHERDVVALGREVAGDGEDAAVVVAQRKPGRQDATGRCG